MRPEIAKAVRELEKIDGSIVPEDVVQVARDPKHVLHNLFEWDDKKAANAHRLDQARRLIREVRIVYREPESDMTPIPVYVRDPGSKSNHAQYKSVMQVASEFDCIQTSMLAEFRRCRAHVRRSVGLAEYWQVRADEVYQLAGALDTLIAALEDDPHSVITFELKKKTGPKKTRRKKL